MLTSFSLVHFPDLKYYCFCQINCQSFQQEMFLSKWLLQFSTSTFPQHVCWCSTLRYSWPSREDQKRWRRWQLFKVTLRMLKTPFSIRKVVRFPPGKILMVVAKSAADCIRCCTFADILSSLKLLHRLRTDCCSLPPSSLQSWLILTPLQAHQDL